MQLFDNIWVKLVSVLLLALAIGGCATLKNLFNDDNERAARVVITVAVMDITSKNPEYRERIVEITKSVREYLDKEPEGRAADIVTLVDKQIRWEKLTQEQSLIVNSILVAVEVELTKRIQDGGIDPESRLKVLQVVQWIEQAARA